jgi:hypothetical protein
MFMNLPRLDIDEAPRISIRFSFVATGCCGRFVCACTVAPLTTDEAAAVVLSPAPSGVAPGRASQQRRPRTRPARRPACARSHSAGCVERHAAQSPPGERIATAYGLAPPAKNLRVRRAVTDL